MRNIGPHRNADHSEESNDHCPVDQVHILPREIFLGRGVGLLVDLDYRLFINNHLHKCQGISVAMFSPPQLSTSTVRVPAEPGRK